MANTPFLFIQPPHQNAHTQALLPKASRYEGANAGTIAVGGMLSSVGRGAIQTRAPTTLLTPNIFFLPSRWTDRQSARADHDLPQRDLGRRRTRHRDGAS